jgi:hypothetical protein
MPQLPSGLHLALDASPIRKLIDGAFEGKFVHDLMAIEHLGHLFEHVNILYFQSRSASPDEVRYHDSSLPPPGDLEPYQSGFNLFTIREAFENWSTEDQAAFEAYLNEERVGSYLQAQLDSVIEAKNQLLAQPSTMPGLMASWWKAGCHPLQEE